MAPVFSLVLDKDVSEDLALLYPELYKDLIKVSAGNAKIRRRLMPSFDSGTNFVDEDVFRVANHQRLPRYVVVHMCPTKQVLNADY